jgi:hypothetical protein
MSDIGGLPPLWPNYARLIQSSVLGYTSGSPDFQGVRREERSPTNVGNVISSEAVSREFEAMKRQDGGPWPSIRRTEARFHC